MARQLNVGCGRDIRPAEEGWVNMDIAPLEGVDVVHNLLEFPWPIESGTFDHVYCSHIMEHIPHHYGGKDGKDGFIKIMEEFHRILRPGGTVEIRSPHPDSIDVWADPTHTRVVHPKNFHYFEPESNLNYYTSARFRTRVCEVSKRSASLEGFLRIGPKRLGLTTHLAERLPFLRSMLYRRPWELRVVVEKVAKP